LIYFSSETGTIYPFMGIRESCKLICRLDLGQEGIE